MKTDNKKALEGIRKYLTSETDAKYVAEALDDAYYLLAQQMAMSIDDNRDILQPPKNSVSDTLYSIHRLKEVLSEASPDPS